ncbi:hypothetical protein [Frankia sp. AgB32]|uniref:hypothetical protein n=1 Tax=Frankia sp. AgB32 TaxID=631119 RepID=UPI00200F02BB|nr:hypothetical protein [Frankia sp. AgB32]MCK9895240.1 hypothetical protein [Frankia sp. AgB32]
MAATSRIQRQAQTQQRDRQTHQSLERLREGYRAGAIRQDLRRTSQTQQQTRG